MGQRFDLAPMDMLMRAVTLLLLSIPLVMSVSAYRAPAPISWALTGASVFVVLAYLGVYLGLRPTHFEIDGDALRICWPLRARSIPRSSVRSVRAISGADFRREYGYGIRTGAGGLWGGFGLLKTSKVTFSMWVSRVDLFVIVELADQRPLLVTPEHLERFVASLMAT